MLVMQSTSSGMQASTETIERRNWLYEMWQSWKENEDWERKTIVKPCRARKILPQTRKSRREWWQTKPNSRRTQKGDELTSPVASFGPVLTHSSSERTTCGSPGMAWLIPMICTFEQYKILPRTASWTRFARFASFANKAEKVKRKIHKTIRDLVGGGFLLFNRGVGGGGFIGTFNSSPITPFDISGGGARQSILARENFIIFQKCGQKWRRESLCPRAPHRKQTKIQIMSVRCAFSVPPREIELKSFTTV